MSIAAEPVPYLAEWKATLGVSTSPQYASQVRKFLAGRGGDSIASVSRDELVRYCAGFESKQKRWLVMGALDRYFEFLEDREPDFRHPAPGLAKKVAAFRERRDLEQGLAAGGVTLERAATLRWRDVARDLVGPKPFLPTGLEERVREQLVGGLLDKLRSASPQTVSQVLDLSVLG